MRHAILADIHGNLVAFEAVLQHIKRQGGVDELWCLGDIVGYGPQPRECIQLLREYDHISIAGNHDLAAIDKIDISDFNPNAAAACLWTADQLDAESVTYLDNLPMTLRRSDFTLVHGSPRQPVWEYLLSESSARCSLAHFQTKFCLVGHSHIPLCFVCFADGSCSLRELRPELGLAADDYRLIINPGSVGQPRDGDPRASYVVHDAETGVLYHYRVPYDIATVQQRMVENGLPLHLALRLIYGQ